MIRYTSSKQMSLDGFTHPFGGQLNPKNRWVKWSEVIPWEGLAIGYYRTMDTSKDARLVKLQRQYWIIQCVYEQQDGMYKDRRSRCDNRIISISQPHVRPIVRGKAGKKTEFGAKISVSMTDGLAFVDHIGWDAFNESKDLKQQVEEYKQRYGYYPEAVLADQLYGSRENRKYLKENGIRFGGKALGRPPKKTPENEERLQLEREQRILDSRERIPIEGKFGQGKNGYRLNYIRAKLQKTSEAWINCIFLVMNLMVLLRELYEKLKISPQLDLLSEIKKLTARLIDFLAKFYRSVPISPSTVLLIF